MPAVYKRQRRAAGPSRVCHWWESGPDFWLPQVGAKVWIEFEQGDPSAHLVRRLWAPGTAHRPLRRCKPVLQDHWRRTSSLIDDTPGWAGSRSRPLRGYVLSSPATGIALQTFTGEKIEVSPVGITIQSAAGHSIMINAAGICLSTSTGATVPAETGNIVDINAGALESSMGAPLHQCRQPITCVRRHEAITNFRSARGNYFMTSGRQLSFVSCPGTATTSPSLSV